MKAFLVAVLVTVGMAVAASYLLDTRLQRESTAAFSTSGVRL